MNAGLPGLLLAGIAMAAPAHAQQVDPAVPGIDAAAIGDAAGRDLAGRGAINLAAGSGNLQANLAAVALSADGLGLIQLQAQQHTGLSPGQWARLRERDASARIDGQAFAGSSGLLSVNQVAGSGNTQRNLFALGNTDIAIAATAPAGVDDATLAAVAGSSSTAFAASSSSAVTEAWPGQRHAVIAEGAFHGSQGVLQVNQTAGVGNASTNAIVLQLPGGAW